MQTSQDIKDRIRYSQARREAGVDPGQVTVCRREQRIIKLPISFQCANVLHYDHRCVGFITCLYNTIVNFASSINYVRHRELLPFQVHMFARLYNPMDSNADMVTKAAIMTTSVATAAPGMRVDSAYNTTEVANVSTDHTRKTGGRLRRTA